VNPIPSELISQNILQEISDLKLNCRASITNKSIYIIQINYFYQILLRIFFPGQIKEEEKIA
jgi:hypothetical protein